MLVMHNKYRIDSSKVDHSNDDLKVLPYNHGISKFGEVQFTTRGTSIIWHVMCESILMSEMPKTFVIV